MGTRTRLPLLLRLEDRISVRSRRSDLSKILELLALKRGSKLLDVGGGTGALAAVFAGDGVMVTVLEPNPKKVAFGRVRHPQVEFLEGGAERIALGDASFDCAMAMLSFHHMEEPDRALREVQRVLSPSGRFLLEEFHPEFAPGALARRIFGRRHGGHPQFSGPLELRAALGAVGFRDVVTARGRRTYFMLAVR